MYTNVHKRHAHAHNHVHACTHTHTHAHLLLTQMYMPFCMTREVLAHFSLIRLLLKCKYSLRSVMIWSRLTRGKAMSINNTAIISPRPTLFNSPSWLNTTLNISRLQVSTTAWPPPIVKLYSSYIDYCRPKWCKSLL